MNKEWYDNGDNWPQLNKQIGKIHVTISGDQRKDGKWWWWIEISNEDIGQPDFATLEEAKKSAEQHVPLIQEFLDGLCY